MKYAKLTAKPSKFYHFSKNAIARVILNGELEEVDFNRNILLDPARVVFTPTIQYLPLHLNGIIHCHIESHPPFQFITWTKDKRIFDPFDMEEIQTLTNGSLLITKVRPGISEEFDPPCN